MATSLRLFSPQSCADGRPWPSSARPAVSGLRHHCAAGALPFRLSRVHQCPSMLLGLGPPHRVRSVAAAGCLSALFVRVPVLRLFSPSATFLTKFRTTNDTVPFRGKGLL